MEHSLGMLPQTTNKKRLVQDLFQELSHASLGSWYPTGQLGGVPEMWDDAYLPYILTHTCMKQDQSYFRQVFFYLREDNLV